MINDCLEELNFKTIAQSRISCAAFLLAYYFKPKASVERQKLHYVSHELVLWDQKQLKVV